MKNLLGYSILISFLLLGLLQSGHSQTKIEPLMGVTFANVTGDISNEFAGSFALSNEGFPNRNNMGGIGIMQHVNKRWYLKFNFNFCRHHMDFVDFGIVGFTDVRFTKLSYSVIPAYRIHEKVSFGFGLSINQLNHFHLGKIERNIWSSLDKNRNQHQVGWIGLFRYDLRPVSFELRISRMIAKNVEPIQFVRRILSAEIQAGIPITLLK